MNDPHELATAALTTLTGGDSGGAETLLPIVYDELRGLAAAWFRNQPADHTLQPTALVHEAYARLVGAGDFESRAHFTAVAAVAMRRILINHAEARGALKRGGGRQRVPLDAAEPAAAQPNDLLALDRALQTLAEHDERKANVVEMRYFGGMTVEMVAQVLDVSRSTVEADWRLARAWLSNELDGGTDG